MSTRAHRRYLYLGDRLSDPALRLKNCRPVVRVSDGKCIRGRGAMLVCFDHEAIDMHRVVLARQLRRFK